MATSLGKTPPPRPSSTAAGSRPGAPGSGASANDSRPGYGAAGGDAADITDSGTLPPLYEAAILYAADHYNGTSEALKEYIREPAGKNNLRAWQMLFDFYQITHNRKEFEALSMLFTVKWERSPPAWLEHLDGGDPRRKEQREHKDFFAIKPGSDNALLPEIDRLEVFVKEMGSARIDFAKVKFILAEEAELFSLVLQRVRRAKLPLWFNALAEFAKLLRKFINDTPGGKAQGYWNLLFELYILDGRLNEYEELGLEYAVAFETSPPAWEKVSRPTGPQAPDIGAAAIGSAGTALGFPLKGVLSTSSKEMLSQLAIYANTEQEVVVDMSQLLRIDFNMAGQFFEAIRAINLSQKRVILSNLNELVAALLEVFGMSKHALLMRKKAS